MATQLTLVNNVLRRLREDTVTSVADNAYAQLIAMFINDGIREVQEAYDWPSLRGQTIVTLVAAQDDYDLSATTATTGDVDVGSTVVNDDSMLRYDSYGRPLVYQYDDSNDTEPNTRPLMVDPHDIINMRSLDRDETEPDPTHFAVQLRSGGGYQLKVWPTPTASRQFIMYWTNPQQALAIDGTDDATSITVPSAPVEAYATMIAANERGEEIGEPGNLLEQRYQRVLGGAIEASMSSEQRNNRYESWRD